MICADFAQMEMRLIAYLADETTLLQDCHANIYVKLASRIFGRSEHEVSSTQREKAKVICLAIIYGMVCYAHGNYVGDVVMVMVMVMAMAMVWW